MHLTRNETEKCVMARIVRQKKLHQKNFTLKQFGTWAKAETAARKWVKVTLAELPPPIGMKNRMTSRNTSGVVGVRLVHAVRRREDKEYPDWRWIAFWPGCPNSGGIGWSVNKYGDEHAFVLACLARKLESVDRDAIDAEFETFKTTRDYKRLLKLKQITPA
ncbi:hypothetical protein [Scleromatobacter humisilvae]|uniref:AP2 domain-containing protein n=1 Tax=Scleromatobacter humisilvae TaxID=2897159 RepID=A0A9X1YLQ8_9BURK|nr:hypothetical protein [Scleromatobacter humisilvae]MCK9687765.1 hypothetical protein [Scleromatobacter humisilvae]